MGGIVNKRVATIKFGWLFPIMKGISAVMCFSSNVLLAGWLPRLRVRTFEQDLYQLI